MANGKKKSKTARRQELQAVDDDIIYLYIDNPYGVGRGADLRRSGKALEEVSNWIYTMLGGLDEHSISCLPDRILAHSQTTTSVILPLEVRGRDEEKVSYLLGFHDFYKLVAGGDMQHATVRISKVQSEDILLGSRELITMHT